MADSEGGLLPASASDGLDSTEFRNVVGIAQNLDLVPRRLVVTLLQFLKLFRQALAELGNVLRLLALEGAGKENVRDSQGVVVVHAKTLVIDGANNVLRIVGGPVKRD